MPLMRLCDLVEDLDFYPRLQIDPTHVGHLLEAAEAGCEFPPLVVCKKSKRIVDGFHRRRVYLRKYGPEHRVEVTLKSYKSDAEMFLDAVRLNAGHGRRLTTADKVRVIARAQDLKIDPAQVASAVALTVDRLGELRTTRMATGESLRVVPLKATIRHMANETLTEGQEGANSRLGGQQQGFYVNQVIMLLENGLVDEENGQLLERLRRLWELLGERFAAA